MAVLLTGAQQRSNCYSSLLNCLLLYKHNTNDSKRLSRSALYHYSALMQNEQLNVDFQLKIF